MAQLPRSQLAAYAVIALSVLVLGGRWLARGQPEPPPASTVQKDAARPAVEQPSRRAIVHVAGAVRRPGVYRLAAGARVRDALRRAGGATSRADANAINLAAPVQDGVQVVVPRRASSAAAAASGAPAALAETAPVNLNTASAEELQTLDGVGPATAADILGYRSQHGGFRSVEDLDQVPGIGPKTMEALRDKVVV